MEKVLKTSFLGSLSSGALGVLHNCTWCGELEHITYGYVIGKFLRPITRKQQYYDFNVLHYVCVICFSTKFCIAFVFVSLKVTIISLKSNRKQHLSIVLRGKQSASCGTWNSQFYKREDPCFVTDHCARDGKLGMIGSLDEKGRKTDLLMASDVKCTRREPNNTHLVSVIDHANILKFGHESSSFTGYSIFTLTFHLWYRRGCSN